MENLKDYDELECPVCDRVCKPNKVLKNGTVVYETHDCINESDYSFRIDEDGNLIEED